ncbi:MAG TPA: hydantoinase B/oxoprolinase family protein [Gemmatimonadota bacterium]|nr:hydantoinase B/oxoprolinase family protein [Gemmatimonadota bacterium]
MSEPLPEAAARTLFAGLMASVADEMLEALVRTAFSPNIKERRDASTAVFDGRGRLVAQAAAIPVHLGAMPLSVEAALAAFETWRAGDVVVLNDPFRGGTHLPDVTTVSPVFDADREEPAAFLAARAHHADVGGATPGSMPLARDIHEEGLRIPPVRLVEAGAAVAPVWEMILANVRTPAERRGDLKAQIACHRTGERRMAEALRRYGAPGLARRSEGLLDYGERMMRSVIERIPDGEYEFEDVLDGDGAGTTEIPIRVRIEIRGERATVDFSGSAPECPGGVNAVLAVTRSAVLYVFLGLLVTPWEEGAVVLADPPLNDGCFRPIQVVAPEGTVVHARPPRAVAAGNVETSQRIVDVVLGALAGALPHVVPAASQGTMNNLALGGFDPRLGAPFAFYETIAGGSGATPRSDGRDAVHSHMTNTWNTPVEALEMACPLRVERYEIRQGSGGRGLHRGGDGVVREIRALAPCAGTLLAERRRSRPYGLKGGEPGTPGRDQVIRGEDRQEIPAKVRLDLAAGDRLSIATPGGGGWGNPDDSRRSPRSEPSP